jgi:excisionase family DNA binding protein
MDEREQQPLLLTQEAAKLLRLHPKTVQRMARDGNVPGLRFGKLWRFRRKDLDAWLDAKIQSMHHPRRVKLGECLCSRDRGTNWVF